MKKLGKRVHYFSTMRVPSEKFVFHAAEE